MKTKSKYIYYTTLLISALTAPFLVNNLVQACGGDGIDWRENSEVFFQPDLESGQKRLEPFYYSLYLRNWPSKEEPASSEDPAATDDNTATWFKKFKGKINQKHIYDFLYHSEKYVSENTPNIEEFTKIFNQHPFISGLNQIKDSKAIQYFTLAKANEYGTEELDNGWNYFNEYDAYGTENLEAAPGSDKLLPFITEQLKKEKDPFYKQRYAFQIIRYARYHYIPYIGDSLYQIYFDSTTEGSFKYAALNYATDALVNEGNQAKANYYASLLFNKSEEKQERAFNNFSNTLPIDVVLPYCKNDAERAKVYALYAFKDFYCNAAYIQKAVELDPQNNTINDLIVREINKSEYKLMPVIEGYYSNMYEPEESDHSLYNEEGVLIRSYVSTDENIPQLISLIKTLQNQNKQYQNFYQLCLAHLYLVTGDYTKTQNYLNAIKLSELPTKMRLQHQLTAAILQIKSNDFKKAENRNALIENIQFIDQNADAFYYDSFLPNGIKLMAMVKLLEARETARAYLLAEKISTIFDSYTLFSNHIQAEDIDQIIDIRNSPKGLFEQILTSKSVLSNDELRRIQGSLYLRQKNILMANKCFAMGDKTFIPIDFNKLNTNPDGHPCYPSDYSLIPKEQEEYYTPDEIKRHNERALKLAWDFNHYSITKTMLDLEQKIKTKKGNMAQNYYHLACLYMEISFYGRAYTAMQFSGDWSWYEISFYSDVNERSENSHNAHYYGSAWAIPYLEQALKYSKNRELSAKILYALFRCNRHLQDYLDKQEDEKDLNYLFQLHDKYANTQYYKIKECWGLTAYVNDLRLGKEKGNK